MAGASADDHRDARRSALAEFAGRRIPGGRSRLHAGELHLWQYDLDRVPAEPLAASILSELEFSRAARLFFDRDRRRFCAGRLALRRILSRYVGDPPESLTLATRVDGKPYLADSDIEFNVSHSQNVWICVIADGIPVGVDVEVLRVVPDCLALARHHFSKVEADALAAVPAEHRDPAFLACWTRKESYLKVLGLGISADLDAFVAGFGPGDVTLESIAPGIARDVHLRTFSPGSGAIGALGFAEKPSRIEYFVASDPAIAETKPLVP